MAFATVWDDNFTKDLSLNSKTFPTHWGSASEFAFINGVTITSNGTAAGFITPDGKSTDLFGYGLYKAVVEMPPNQSAGAYVNMWPASNVWPGPEIDLVEQWNGQPYATVHWKGANGSDQYQTHNFNANLSKPTTVAVDWERSGLTYYINGKELVSYPAGGSVPVPKDAADGGQNEAFSVGDSGPAGTKITVLDMSFSHHV